MSTSSHSYQYAPAYSQHSPSPSLVRSPTHSTQSSLSTSRTSNPSSVARRKRAISPALKVAAWQSTMSSNISSLSSDSYSTSPQVATYEEPEPQAPVQMRDVNLIPDYIIVARCLGETIDEDYQFSPPTDAASSRNSTATDPRSSYFSDPRSSQYSDARSSYFSVPPSDADLDEQEQEQEDNGELAGVQEEDDDTQDEKDEGEPEGIFVPRFIKNQRRSYEQQQHQEERERDREDPVAIAIRSEGRGLTNSVVDLSVYSPTALKKSKHKLTKSSGTRRRFLSLLNKF